MSNVTFKNQLVITLFSTVPAFILSFFAYIVIDKVFLAVNNDQVINKTGIPTNLLGNTQQSSVGNQYLEHNQQIEDVLNEKRKIEEELKKINEENIALRNDIEELIRLNTNFEKLIPKNTTSKKHGDDSKDIKKERHKQNIPNSGLPKANEPKITKPKAAEPKAAEPKAAEPKAAEPKAAEPKAIKP